VKNYLLILPCTLLHATLGKNILSSPNLKMEYVPKMHTGFKRLNRRLTI